MSSNLYITERTTAQLIQNVNNLISNLVKQNTKLNKTSDFKYLVQPLDDVTRPTPKLKKLIL